MAVGLRRVASVCLCLGCLGTWSCARITSRQARLGEEGRRTTLPAPSAWNPSDLSSEAASFPSPRRQVIEAALSQAGTPSSAVDCSGLVVRVYAAAGLRVPRTVRAQLAAGRPVPTDRLRPGDLVFFAFGRRSADHVGIYAGRGAFVHVSSAGRVVRLESLADTAFASNLVAARSLLPDAGE